MCGKIQRVMNFKLLTLFVLAAVPSLGAASAMLWWPGTALGQGIFAASKIALVVIPVASFFFVEGNQRALWPKFSRVALGSAAMVGAVLGTVASLLFFGLVHFEILAVDRVVESARASGLDRPAVFVALSLYWIFINSLIEELVWRWFFYRRLKAFVSPKKAVLLSAAAFTLHHIIALAAQFPLGWALLMSVGVFIAGVVFAWIYEKRQSVLPAYVCHLILDVPIFVFGYWLIFLR